MKKKLIIVIVLLLLFLAGCGKKKEVIYGCDDCVYSYSNDTQKIGDELNNYKKYYSDLKSNIFLGYKIDKKKKIVASYICGIENGKAFCLEGNLDDSKYKENQKIINKVYSEDECGIIKLDGQENYNCNGKINVSIANIGVNRINDSKTGQCYIYSDGKTSCENNK